MMLFFEAVSGYPSGGRVADRLHQEADQVSKHTPSITDSSVPSGCILIVTPSPLTTGSGSPVTGSGTHTPPHSGRSTIPNFSPTNPPVDAEPTEKGKH